jgi:hypothetical protein
MAKPGGTTGERTGPDQPAPDNSAKSTNDNTRTGPDVHAEMNEALIGPDIFASGKGKRPHRMLLWRPPTHPDGDPPDLPETPTMVVAPPDLAVQMLLPLCPPPATLTMINAMLAGAFSTVFPTAAVLSECAGPLCQ